jgi:hypothetical protein
VVRMLNPSFAARSHNAATQAELGSDHRTASTHETVQRVARLRARRVAPRRSSTVVATSIPAQCA